MNTQVGRPKFAALGLNFTLGITDLEAFRIASDGVRAIREEFQKYGGDEDKEILRYILDEKAKEQEDPMSYGGTAVRDKGRTGWTLSDFVCNENAFKAKLTTAHVAALRIYSSRLFNRVNGPLREGIKPHPFAATTLLTSIALRKLRVMNTAGPTEAVELWRGMRDLQVTDEFMSKGGTELACMSTSTSVDVVAEYAKSKQPLLFRLQTDDFLNRGADISWVSFYPSEKEILYPPLTYLRPVSRKKIENSSGFVVTVVPTIAS
jgi:hypothetical protein